jgi:predicted DNA-binding transcriptional regulator YafY
MATNKHATIRYQALDKCFQNIGRIYFIDDLVEACNKAIFNFDGNSDGVKKRQVQADINFMQSESGFAIELEKVRENRKVYYRYLDSSFSINKQPLNPTEETQLREALLTLSRFKGMPQFAWVDELTVKLESELGLSGTDKKVIEFEQNEYLVGLEHISVLYHAIVNKQTLLIDYQSFRAEESKEIAFIPHYLKQFNNRWFVFGVTENFDSITNLALDRMIGIKVGNGDYLESNIDYEEHFEDVVGVSIPADAKLETILLKVDASLYPYIKTKPLHGSQKPREENEDYTIIELELYPNYELESMLLSFGEKVEVKQPDSLRERLKVRLQNAVKNY